MKGKRNLTPRLIKKMFNAWIVNTVTWFKNKTYGELLCSRLCGYLFCSPSHLFSPPGGHCWWVTSCIWYVACDKLCQKPFESLIPIGVAKFFPQRFYLFAFFSHVWESLFPQILANKMLLNFLVFLISLVKHGIKV